MAETRSSAHWASPITSKSIFESRKNISNLYPWKDGLLFLITEPSEGNASVLMYYDLRSEIERVSPRGTNIRSKVHEYGGRPFTAYNEDVYYCNFEDQEIYKQSFQAKTKTFSPPEAITTTLGDKVRYVDLTVDRARNLLIAVREDHSGVGTNGEEAKNSLIAIPLCDSEFPKGLKEQVTLFEDSDFVSSPSFSDDGASLSFVTWNHPNMPWDKTDLVYAKIDENGGVIAINKVDENCDSSKTQPFFAANGDLFFLSDKSGYWNLRRCGIDTIDTNLRSENIYEVEYDCCGPPWVTGKRNFAMCGTSEVAVSVLKDCDWEIRVFNYAQKQERVLHPKLGVLDDIVCSEIGLFYLAGDWKNYPGIYLCSEEESNFLAPRTLTRPKIPATFTESLISSPQHLTFKSNNNEEAHGIYYAPKNSQFCLPKDELPPLLVNVHGGPTGTAQKAFNPMHQFWTSRGFAVFDLNHRGSSGYGRNFRKKLYGGWGVVDVEDAISATKFLVERELANATQIAIRGGSAGGYLVLACLAASDCFSAGASYYGIADLELLTKDTHKFESQYLERLIGPYPEARELYKDRSPIHKLENIAAPVLILQGKLDKIVPPNQADLLYKKLVKGNTRTELILFENEGHGFRAPANQIRALDSELAFYRKNLLAKDGK